MPFYIGLLVLAGATASFGLATSVWVLIFSRILQGLSSAIVYTVGLALIVDTVDREEVGQWIGTALSCSSIGLIVSPFLGGLVYAKLGYLAVFIMALGLIFVDVLMRLLMIEKRVAKRYRMKCRLCEENDPRYGTFSATNPVPEVISQDEDQAKSRQTSPMPIPRIQVNGNDSLNNEQSKEVKRHFATLTLLRSPRLLAALYGVFVNVSILCSFDGVLPLFVKQTFHWDSLGAGALFLCLSIPALAGPLVGKLSDRFGPRWIAATGFVMTTPSLILLQVIERDTIEQKIALCILLTLCGESPLGLGTYCPRC